MKKNSLLLFLIASFFTAHGQDWQELGTGSDRLRSTHTISSICSDTGGVVYAAGIVDSSSGKFCVKKWNPQTSVWTTLGSDTAFYSFGEIDGLCVDMNHYLYAGINKGNPFIKSTVVRWDGISWQELGIGANGLNGNNPINALCTDAVGGIYAAGSFTDGPFGMGHCYVAKWDGEHWLELGTGSDALNPNKQINAIETDKHGYVYAAGDFDTFQIPGYHNYVAQWDGFHWHQLGTGTNILPSNIGVSSLAADTQGYIYATTIYSSPGLVSMYVAKWNGSDWSELGAGGHALNANDFITKIKTDNAGNVYAGGLFTDPEGKIYVAKWDHNTDEWHPLGSDDLNAHFPHDQGPIYSLDVNTDGDVYVGGDFCDDTTLRACHTYVAKFAQMISGIHAIGSETETIVYPNPTTGELHLTDNEAGSYTLYSIMGKEVMKCDLPAKNASFDISGLPNGIYLLKLKSSGSILKIEKQ